ncbi:MAG TPA: hypothetical protein VEZ89_03805 [Rubrivivax sp.]|nr:hypothetical protein [Rubrivivax sp.]
MHNKHLVRPAVGTALLLLVPAVLNLLDRGKPAGDGWNWGPGDFLIMGGLLFGAGLLYEVIKARARTRPQRWALAAAIIAVVFVIWVELAVNGVSQLAGWALG